jgi:enoyl-CoA hydratase
MSYWEIERKGPVLIASYNNPPMNYYCMDAINELRGLRATFEDPDVRVIILQGGPQGFFITHFSVEDLAAMAADPDMKNTDHTLYHGLKPFWFELETLEKPVICAMTGSTMGGGLEQALGCDIRIAEQGDYLIGWPEARLGILPGGAGLTRMTRMFGAKTAINYVMRSMVFSPDEALARGFVHEVATDARARALEIANELAAFSPVAMRSIKRAIYEGEEAPLEEQLILETKGFAACMQSDEGLSLMQEYVATPYQERAKWIAPKG